jgi:hypothetical protein
MLKSGVFAALMMAALPVLIVVVNTIAKRDPAGIVARYAWLLYTGAAVVYVVAGVDAYTQSAKVSGGLLMASGIALFALAGAEFWFRRLEKPVSK